MKIKNIIILSAIILVSILSYLLCAEMDKNKINERRIGYLEMALSEDITQRFDPIRDTIIETIYRDKDTIIYTHNIYERGTHIGVAESTINKTYYDSIKRALDVAEDAITRVTRINGEMSKKLKREQLRNEELENNIWHWRTENADIRANLNDSTAQVKYDAKITITDFSRKPNFFSNREYFTAISTNDNDLKINGLQSFEKKLDVKCPKVNFGIQGGYGAVYLDNNFRLAPYIGAGLTFDVF